MTDRERRIIETIMERARKRAREWLASEKAKPADPMEDPALEDRTQYDTEDED